MTAGANDKTSCEVPVDHIPADSYRIPEGKYRPYLSLFKVSLPDRTWPDQILSVPPRWCSVDLRDGNQALVNPMNLEQKLEMWKLLVEIGFKEIETGFPSAAAVEFDFTRTLIENNLIPDDVWPQVLTQARPHLIERTFASLAGAKRAIVHLYNSTSELQRRVVFQKDKPEIIGLVLESVEQVKQLAAQSSTEIRLEYSPESFTGTELDFALEICEAVVTAWGPTPANKIILNLPSTVEMSTPNIYADQVEWFCRNLTQRELVTISIHTHNDRGTAVAAAEMAMMAGAERIEGTLFGNGERTGNVDIVTIALNLLSQGIDPKIDFHDIKRIRSIAERCTQLPVHPRQPYAGDLVFTAFSGSHQDAIRKGVLYRRKNDKTLWEVPYLPIDPADVGRRYEPIIRINSQSGKGGVAFIMETEYGYALPKNMHPEFSAIIQAISDKLGREVSADQIWQAFGKTYLEVEAPYQYLSYQAKSPVDNNGDPDQVCGELKLSLNGECIELTGQGNGPIDACKNAILQLDGVTFRLTDFVEHALSPGSDAKAAAYIEIERDDSERFYGVGVDANTQKASIKALICAVNRAFPAVEN